MNTLNRKNISVALLLTISVFFSLNTHAVETTSIESSLSELVIVQSKQMMNDLSEQLQQSIKAEITSFKANFSFDESLTNSLAWITGEDKTQISIESEKSKIESKQTIINTSF
jgi:low affinity Fe/Cu permease